MSTKRNQTILAGEKKKSRQPLTIEKKLEIIRRAESGESLSSIGRLMGINRSTVGTVLKSTEKIKQHVHGAGSLSAMVVTKKRGVVMEEMERSLKIWLDDQHQKNIPVSLQLIQGKALSLMEVWKKRLGEKAVNTPDFHASKGWFDRFKRRANLHNIRFTGESASADKEAAQEFITNFPQILEEGGYSPEQIFNVDETGLFWKKMPARTYLAKEEAVAPGHKPAKDRLTLLLGGNAAGDFKLKPMLVYHSENPRAFKGKTKALLPVIWKSNLRAWVTGALFQDWFCLHFVPAVKEYLRKKNLAFKALLLLDNAPGHPHSIQDLFPEVQVLFLPPNTTSKIQPMDQTVIAI